MPPSDAMMFPVGWAESVLKAPLEPALIIPMWLYELMELMDDG